MKSGNKLHLSVVLKVFIGKGKKKNEVQVGGFFENCEVILMFLFNVVLSIRFST